MKKFLMIAALAFVFAAPAFATDAAAPEAAAPAVVDVAAAKEACTAETNEKVKLPENAGEAEKAQWDAAFAECLKGKGVEEAPAAEATPAVEGEVKTEAAE
jgi:hypothetical protein